MPTIHDTVSLTQNTWAQQTDLPAEPLVVFVSAPDDIRVGYGDTEPVNNYMHVEVNGQMGFSFSVTDASKLWLYSANATAANRVVSRISYRPGEGVIPYC